MRYLKILCLVCLLMPLTGCFLGNIFGWDITVLVDNNTDDDIQVEAGGNITGDSGAIGGGTVEIKRGKSLTMTIAGYEVNPQVKAFYKGKYHIYRVHPDWAGFDEIKVKTTDYPKDSG